MNKYGAIKTVVNGERFDSRKEACRWKELQLLERAGKISGLRRQVRYKLLDAVIDDGGKKVLGAASYVADFVYEQDGETVVEDAKGFKTEAYKLKRKLMWDKHGILVQEV